MFERIIKWNLQKSKLYCARCVFVVDVTAHRMMRKMPKCHYFGSICTPLLLHAIPILSPEKGEKQQRNIPTLKNCGALVGIFSMLFVK